MGMEITSAGLHCLAMLFMLLDHLWATVVPRNKNSHLQKNSAPDISGALEMYVTYTEL